MALQESEFDLFKEFAVNPAAELEGVVIKLGKGASFTVARAGNTNYQRRILEEGDKHRDELDNSPASKELDARLTNQVLAETVFLSYTGKFKGKAFKDTVENRAALLGAPELHDFRRRVISESNKLENYRARAEAKDLQD